MYYEKKSEVNARNNGKRDNSLPLFFFLFHGKTESRYLPIGRRESSTLKSMYIADDKRQLRDAFSIREPNLSFDLNRGNDIYPRMHVQHPELN